MIPSPSRESSCRLCRMFSRPLRSALCLHGLDCPQLRFTRTRSSRKRLGRRSEPPRAESDGLVASRVELLQHRTAARAKLKNRSLEQGTTLPSWNVWTDPKMTRGASKQQRLGTKPTCPYKLDHDMTMIPRFTGQQCRHHQKLRLPDSLLCLRSLSAQASQCKVLIKEDTRREVRCLRTETVDPRSVLAVTDVFGV